jgi:hypothetical protein
MKKLLLSLLSLLLIWSCNKDESPISDARITFTYPSEEALLNGTYAISDSLKFDFEVSSKSKLVLVNCKLIRIDPINDRIGQLTAYSNNENYYEFESNMVNVKWLIPNKEELTTETALILKRDTSTINDELHIEVITEDHKKEFVYQFTNINWSAPEE